MKTMETTILPLNELCVLLQNLRFNKKVVLTNGCFDILHIGHTELLRFAKTKGDILVVALNDDSSIKNIKGNGRPVITLEMRATVINSLKPVDFVTYFSEKNASNVVKKLKPDCYVKDSEYDIKNTPEGIEVLKQGGKVYGFPRIKEISTTLIVNKILSFEGE